MSNSEHIKSGTSDWDEMLNTMESVGLSDTADRLRHLAQTNPKGLKQTLMLISKLLDDLWEQKTTNIQEWPRTDEYLNNLISAGTIVQSTLDLIKQIREGSE